MSQTVYVHGARRVVLARFANSVHGTSDGGRVPPPDLPWLDTRGHNAPLPWPVMPMMQGRTAWVRIDRVHLPPEVPLFVSTSAASKVAILGSSRTPSGGTVIPDTGLTGAGEIYLKLNARTRPDDDHADVSLHVESPSGPELHRLRVMTFRPVTIPVRPHLVALDSSTQGREQSAASLEGVLGAVRRIWVHYGVSLDVRAARTHRHRVASTDALSSLTELDGMFAAFNEPGELNVYFVEKLFIQSPPTFDLPSTRVYRLGFGFPRSNGAGVRHPGIVVAATTVSSPPAPAGARPEPYTDGERAYVVAHEIGHFFGLTHPVEERALNEHNDNLWTQGMLMHPTARRLQRGEWLGRPRSGSMLTLKAAWPGDEPDITVLRRNLEAPDLVAQLA